MSDDNIVSDNTDDLSSLFDGSVTKLSVRITCDASSGVEQIHYKEVTVRCNSYVTCFVTVFDISLMLSCVMSLFFSRFQTLMLMLKSTVIAAV